MRPPAAAACWRRCWLRVARTMNSSIATYSHPREEFPIPPSARLLLSCSRHLREPRPARMQRALRAPLWRVRVAAFRASPTLFPKSPPPCARFLHCLRCSAPIDAEALLLLHLHSRTRRSSPIVLADDESGLQATCFSTTPRRSWRRRRTLFHLELLPSTFHLPRPRLQARHRRPLSTQMPAK